VIWAGGRLVDAWPAEPDEDEYDRTRTSDTETLLIGGSLDFSTPAENATRELLPQLPNGHKVVLPGFGHTNDFWSLQPAAGSRLVNAYLDSGKVDDSLYTDRDVDFTPTTTLGAIAKSVLGVMVAFAALVVLSLLWLALRVNKRGGVGARPARCCARSPDRARSRRLVPRRAARAHDRPDRPARRRTARGALDRHPDRPGDPLGLGPSRPGAPSEDRGFAAAIVGAFVGAWFGFHVTAGLFAVFTTITGATAGANLILLVLDSARDRTARETATAPSRPAVTSAGA
jgi:hypothetical protein